MKSYKWFITIGRCLIILFLLALLYLALELRKGYFDPKKRERLARQICQYEKPEAYNLSFAIYAPFSKMATFHNPKTNQRFWLIKKPWGKEKNMQKFRQYFSPVGKFIPEYNRLGGFENMLINSIQPITVANRKAYCVLIAFQREGKKMQGMICCLPLAAGDEEGPVLIIIAAAPANNYSHQETMSFLASIKIY